MYEQTLLTSLYAETSLHVGSGSSFGVIDLPIQREKYTDFPMCAASGIKGAVREWFERQLPGKTNEINIVFGPEDGSDYASCVSFSDARILLFPVRSAKGVFVWITCPMVFNRFLIDLHRAGFADTDIPKQLSSDGGKVGVENKTQVVLANNKILLEESAFDISATMSTQMQGLGKWISEKLFPQANEYKFWRDSVPSRLVLLPDDDFTYFVKHSTEVNARIKLSDKKTTEDGGNLFYEENLPPESVLYASIFASRPHADGGASLPDSASVATFVKKLDGKRMQLGGDETVGRGIMNVKILG